MNTIFLDIDGVLNNDYTKERFAGFTGIDKRLCKMFLDWFDKDKYQIVLSSSWRIPSAYGDFLQELRDNGLSWVEETPHLKGLRRGLEIQCSIEELSIEKYVILDDMGPSEFLKHQRPFLVQTSPIHGLRLKNLNKIEQIINHGANHELPLPSVVGLRSTTTTE